MGKKIETYRDLNIWKLGIDLVKDTYRVTETFPKHELYCITSQMRRSAISIPSNIAEGFKRYHNKEYRQFLYVTLGSCAELETQVTIARELKYTPPEEEAALLEKLDHIGRMITNLLKKL